MKHKYKIGDTVYYQGFTGEYTSGIITKLDKEENFFTLAKDPNDDTKSYLLNIPSYRIDNGLRSWVEDELYSSQEEIEE